MSASDSALASAARWDARVAQDPKAKPRDQQEAADKAAAYFMCRCGKRSYYHYRFDHK